MAGALGAIEGEIAARRFRPTEILSHRLPLQLAPSQGLPIESKRPFDAVKQIGRIRLRTRTQLLYHDDRVVSRVHYGIAEPACVSHDGQGAIAHRIKLSEPARLEAGRMKQDVAAGQKPVRKWLLVADAERDPTRVVARR